MAQGLKKTSKVARKTKNVTKRQRTAAAKKTVKKTIKDQVRSGASLPAAQALRRAIVAPRRRIASRRAERWRAVRWRAAATPGRPRRLLRAALPLRSRPIPQVKKKINAQIEKNTGGKAARGGQHFELSAISDSSKQVCAELRKDAGKSKKQMRTQKAKERAIAVATKREESAGIFGP